MDKFQIKKIPLYKVEVISRRTVEGKPYGFGWRKAGQPSEGLLTSTQTWVREATTWRRIKYWLTK